MGDGRRIGVDEVIVVLEDRLRRMRGASGGEGRLRRVRGASGGGNRGTHRECGGYARDSGSERGDGAN